MCNLYDVGPSPRKSRFEWEGQVRDAVGEMNYVAPKKPGIVVRQIGGEMRPVVMRWGFSRPWSPCINNARDDKLDGRTWSDAFKNRRCILPVRRFYEWSGVKGSKTKHSIQADRDHWFWIAGIWEDHPNPEVGLSYSMLTTSANQQMEAIHKRMPAILPVESLEDYLTESDKAPEKHILPYGGDLFISPPVPGEEIEFDFGS